MKTLPTHMYRTNDYTVFHAVNGEGGYSHPEGSTVYSYECLKDHGFVECTEADLPLLAQKARFTMDFLMWQHRPDGHGGCKGGEMEEYLEKHPEKRKIYDEIFTDEPKEQSTEELLEIVLQEVKELRQKVEKLEKEMFSVRSKTLLRR